MGAVGERAWHSLASDEVTATLGSDGERGLSGAEALSRRGVYGPNSFGTEKGVPPLEILARQFSSILVVILLVATLVSALLGEVIDAVVIAAIIALVAAAGFVQEYRAEMIFSALRRRLRAECIVVREGERRTIDVEDLVPGDVVILGAGGRVPADMRLLETAALRVDESSLTGESFPVGKSTSPLSEGTALGDRANMAFSGTTVAYGGGRGVVTETGARSELGKIMKGTLEIRREETPLERRVNEIGKRFGAIALGIIAAVAAVEVLRVALTGGLTPSVLLDVLLFGIALGVAAVPEALPAVVTTTLAIGMRILSKNNTLVRRMSAVETLGSTEVICFDKTGTLTKGEMTVRGLYLDGMLVEVTGVGYSPEGAVVLGEGTGGLRRALSRLARAAILCNDAEMERRDGRWRVVGDPTEGALLVFARKAGFDLGEREALRRVGEVPFSSERKLMTTVHRERGGFVAFMKGAPEVVLQRCRSRFDGDETRELRGSDVAEISGAYDGMSGHGLRVVAMAMKEMGPEPVPADPKMEDGFVFLGLTGMEDPLREDAVEAVGRAVGAGMRPVMVTGDHRATAVAVAERAGILGAEDEVITGEELATLSEPELAGRVEEVAVYARISPLDKLKIVNAWKRKGRVVAMTGDGVNDAPALKRADIGVAMGQTGTDVAKQSADIVLTDDNFATMVKAIGLGRWIYDNIQKYLAYLLQANLVEIAVLASVVFVVAPFFGLEGALPLLPVQLLYVNLATDGLPALALGFSPPDPDLLSRPPRKRDEPVFNREVIPFLVSTLLVQTPVLLLGFTAALGGGLDAARTRLFLMLVFMELALSLNCRSLTQGLGKARPHAWLVLAVAWEAALILSLFQVGVAREALHVLVPTAGDAYWTLAGVAVTFAGGEVTKGLRRQRGRPAAATARVGGAVPPGGVRPGSTGVAAGRRLLGSRPPYPSPGGPDE